jgi:hypothetical protein
MVRLSDDPVLWVHPRFGGEFPQPFNELEIRRALTSEPDVVVKAAKRSEVLRNLAFVKEMRTGIPVRFSRF